MSGLFLGWIILALVRYNPHPRLKVVYLAPSDVTPRVEFSEGVRRSMVAAQRWYFDELEKGVTFALADPAVETVQTRHPESWYSQAGRGTDREALWRMVVTEAFSLTGGSYNDSRYIWVYFLDADLPKIPPQGGGGVGLLLRQDILNQVGMQPSCLTVGAIAHELGHAFGLPHPPDCDSHRKLDGEPECTSMSYLGCYHFPFARYQPEERKRLLRSPAFAAIDPEASRVECSQ
ncbi:MAG TPA: hypothetical protein VKG25_27895 [Bryobacteraceae bacterium]|nr:hypothetical protein [Bryobacteraceae bacterium]